MADMQAWKERVNKTTMPLYDVKDAILDHADGCYVYDVNGKKYLDCAAGIAVVSLGHNNPVLKNAINEQLDKGFTMSNGSFISEPRMRATELLVNNCCSDQVFFTNSGAESVEGSLKLARTWAHQNKSEECKEFIVFRNSFHGRTYGAVSATEKCLHQPQFAPYLPGFHFAEFNNLESVQNLISDKICAIMVEPVQGEGGLIPGTKEFFQGLQKLCQDNNILLISDEIQAGMGRLGTLFAHAYFDYEPDIICLAKGLGSGFPVGAFMAKESIAQCFKVGDHGSTYGGNPLSTNVVYHVVNALLEPGFLDHVKEASTYIHTKLAALHNETGAAIKAVKGAGLMVGIETDIKISVLMNDLLELGMLTTQAGKNTLRLTPPLTINHEEIDEAVEKIATAIKKRV